MKKLERKELETELNQLRISRSIDKANWFEHKRYAAELIQALWASANILNKDADDILKNHLRPTGQRIREIEELLKVKLEKRINTEIIDTLSMGP